MEILIFRRVDSRSNAWRGNEAPNIGRICEIFATLLFRDHGNFSDDIEKYLQTLNCCQKLPLKFFINSEKSQALLAPYKQ